LVSGYNMLRIRVSRNFRSGLSEILMKRWCKLASIFLGHPEIWQRSTFHSAAAMIQVEDATGEM